MNLYHHNKSWNNNAQLSFWLEKGDFPASLLSVMFCSTGTAGNVLTLQIAGDYLFQYTVQPVQCVEKPEISAPTEVIVTGIDKQACPQIYYGHLL